jgi:hypothetical protein
MANDNENSKPGSGADDVGDRRRRERVDYANLILQWAATVEAMRAVTDAWDVSIANLRETDTAFGQDSKNRKIASAVKTIEQFRESEKLSEATRRHLQLLIARLG